MSNSDPMQTYLNEAQNVPVVSIPSQGVLEWHCPSNIALVKYWGKKSDQMPQNPSVSFVLHESFTRVILEYSSTRNIGSNGVEFYFNDRKNPVFQEKINSYLDNIGPLLPFLDKLNLKIHSFNTFPHSAGIASSASAFGSLALGLTNLDYLFHERSMDEQFYKKASYLARIGSGSACRSVYGGFALWGANNYLSESSDYYSISITENVHPDFLTFRDSILVVDDEQKPVSSSMGHNLMHTNPYSTIRFREAQQNTGHLLEILKKGELEDFVMLVEQEALTLHAMMMTSSPAYLLLKPQTVAIIEKIRNYRIETRLPVCFTLDAGANVHLLFPSGIEKRIHQFIEEELLIFCKDKQVINDFVGKGPVRIR